MAVSWNGQKKCMKLAGFFPGEKKEEEIKQDEEKLIKAE